MAIAFTGRGSATAASGTSISVSGVNSSGSSLILITVHHMDTGTASNPCTGVTVGGTGATQAVAYYDNINGVHSNTSIFSYYSAGALSNATVVASYTGTISANGGGVTVVEATGADSTVGNTGTNNGNGGSLTVSATTGAAAGSKIFGAFTGREATSYTAAATTTEIYDVALANGRVYSANNNQAESANTSYAVAATADAGGWYWSAAAVEIIAGATGTAVGESESTLTSDLQTYAFDDGLTHATALQSGAFQSDAFQILGGATTAATTFSGGFTDTSLSSDPQVASKGGITGQEVETTLSSDPQVANKAARGDQGDEQISSETQSALKVGGVPQVDTSLSSDPQVANKGGITGQGLDTALSSDPQVANKGGITGQGTETSLSSDTQAYAQVGGVPQVESTLTSDPQSAQVVSGGTATGEQVDTSLTSDEQATNKAASADQADTGLTSDPQATNKKVAEAITETSLTSETQQADRVAGAGYIDVQFSSDSAVALKYIQGLNVDEACAVLDICVAAISGGPSSSTDQTDVTATSDICAANVVKSAAQVDTVVAADYTKGFSNISPWTQKFFYWNGGGWV
jgi:hypothetical protein